ncbi:MAG: class I SAM-dependent methyltransferase [Acetobacteraceae bacterium]|nr:class I SAM-dependent methyltransferase [Acetobacteraceae bacterium]
MEDPAPRIPNATMREEWNDATGRRWLKRHEAVDRQIAPFGRRAMERANIRPGQHILDIGCGTAETTIELARRVRVPGEQVCCEPGGEGGSVTGIDISHLLLATAQDAAKASGLTNLRFEAGDAQTFAFARERFDVAFSRFGVMFFDNPIAAFANIRSALRPDGLLTFVCWPAPEENPFMMIPLVAAARHITMPEPGPPDAPGPFAFADIERVRRILSQAGFGTIETDRLTETIGGGTRDETASMLLELGPINRIVEGIDAETKDAILADIRASLADYESAGCVRLAATVWLVTARIR